MQKEIAKILRKTENLDCIQKAQSLEAHASKLSSLHLRNLNLKPNDVVAIAAILAQEKQNNNSFIKSISFSYNPFMGDTGAIYMINSLPESILEIGLVGCGITDLGGNEIFKWLKTSSQIQMICMEQNTISDELKTKFYLYQEQHPKIVVVV